MSIRFRLDAAAEERAKFRHLSGRDALHFGRRHNGFRERMLATLLEAGRNCKELLLRDAVCPSRCR